MPVDFSRHFNELVNDPFERKFLQDGVYYLADGITVVYSPVNSGFTAENVPFVPAQNIAATNVQAAVEEVVTDLTARIITNRRRPTLSLLGNSIAITSETQVSTSAFWTMRSIGPWACAVMGQRVVAGNSFGTGSLTSKQIVSAHLQELLNENPGYCVIVAFENDIGGNFSDSQTAADTMLDSMIAQGIMPIVLGPLPSKGTLNNTGNTKSYWNLCRMLAAKCATKGAIYIDAFRLYGDYSTDFAGPISNLVDASVHPYSTAVMRLARAIAAAITSNQIVPLPNLGLGTNSPDNFVENANFNGTDGTFGGTPGGLGSGTLPTGWVGVTNGAGNSAVYSIVPSADDRGEGGPWIQVEFTGSTTNTVILYRNTRALSGTGFAVGDVVEARAEVEFAAGGTGCRQAMTHIAFTGSTTGITAIYSANEPDEWLELPPRMTLRTPPFPIQDGVTSMQFRVQFSGIGSPFNFTARMRHPRLIKSIAA